MVSAARRPTWQNIDSGQLLLIAVAGLTVVAAVTQVAAVGLVHPDTAVIFGVLVALGELARMAMPGDREVAPIGTAGAFGYALLLRVGDEPAGHSPSQVVAVTAVGMVIGSLPHVAVGRSPRLDAIARRLLTVAVAAFVFRLIDDSPPSRDDWPVVLSLMAVVVILACSFDVVTAAVIRAEAVRARFAIALADEIRVKTALCAATATTGMLIAVATSVMGLTALLVFTAPILVTQFAFRRYAGILGTYLQTIRALSRVTEVGGYVETGHSRRVSELSVAMGRELGMPEPKLLDLEYAALMHDIGQLSLRDPIPGGATVLASPVEQRRIAEFGAGVIEQTGVLAQVVEIVRRQADSYRVVPKPAHRGPGQEKSGHEKPGQDIPGQRSRSQEVPGSKVVPGREAVPGRESMDRKVAGQKAPGQRMAGQRVASRRAAGQASVPRQQTGSGVADGEADGEFTAPPLGSRIIKVANAYDDLVGDSADRDRAAAVLERLRVDSVCEYDPAVIEALARVVGRGPLIRR